MSDQIVIDLSGQVFTQSEFAVWDLCDYKWYLQYQLQLELQGHYSWPLIIGSAWHEALETLYKTKGQHQVVPTLRQFFSKEVIFTAELEQEIEIKQEMLEATLQAYAEFFKDDFKAWKIVDLEKTLEVELEVERISIKIAGKRDMKAYLNSKILTLIDHKSAGQINPRMTDGWQFKFQFMLYNWLDYKCSKIKEHATAFMVNVMKKCLLRKGKDENIITFAARVKQDILKRPEEYFYRQHLDLTSSAVMLFEQTMLMPKLRRIAILQKQPELTDILALNKNTDACMMYNTPCQFYAHCYHGESEQFKHRQQKHTELIGE